VRDEELDQPAKIVKKRTVPAAGGGRGGGRRAWGAWQRSSSSSPGSKGGGSRDRERDNDSDDDGGGPAAAAAAGGGGGGNGGKGEETQRLYGRWQTDEWVRKAEGGKVPKNERGNVEVPPLAKAMPLGECEHAHTARRTDAAVLARGAAAHAHAACLPAVRP
jgi:xeroderma pigmentosum group C-complementing protein